MADGVAVASMMLPEDALRSVHIELKEPQPFGPPSARILDKDLLLIVRNAEGDVTACQKMPSILKPQPPPGTTDAPQQPTQMSAGKCPSCCTRLPQPRAHHREAECWFAGLGPTVPLYNLVLSLGIVTLMTLQVFAGAL
jgi:hypothetical protein